MDALKYCPFTPSIARHTINLTMQAVEEAQNPIPQEYFLLLGQKLEEGVQIVRIGFGTDEEFKMLRSRVYIEHPRYTFHRIDSADYRRMLLVDNSKMIFRRIDASGPHVFYSEDPQVIAEYKSYFERRMKNT